ncbi:HAMP domain-containing sensor histidine kinase [Sphingobium sp. Sx8-8]|uniref:sensor histidine kinase n=1 Tax=Sphingobium sp. Sx8-8 TaxID=2933617 RepID=UPI001F57D389|nr:HAMP domain-containing sensor histidine kinase [Sphingobium sp. Sx8-8]
MLLKSLRALTIAFLLLFLSVTLATALGIYFSGRSTTDHLIERRMTAVSMMIAPAAVEADRLEDIRSRLIAAIQDRDMADLGFILLKDGKPVVSNMRIDRPLPVGLSYIDGADRIGGLSHGRALVRDVGQGVRLAVIAKTEPSDNDGASRKHIYLLGFGSIVAVVLAAAMTFTLIIRKRMVEMRRAMDAISKGDLSRRVPVNGSDTVFNLQAQAFNRMLGCVTDRMEDMRHMANGVAHELRTPVARLRNQLNLIAHDPQAAPVRDKIGKAQAQADALLGIFSALLRLAEIDGGARRANFAPIDLASLIEECVEELDAVAEDSAHRLVTQSLEQAMVHGDRQLLSQMIVNLVENALRHTPAGTDVRISLSREQAGEVLLTVADNGPGIAPADRAKALDRFGRLAGSADADGHGFGLPLVASIARLHGGSVELGDAQPGLKVDVLLPSQPVG